MLTNFPETSDQLLPLNTSCCLEEIFRWTSTSDVLLNYLTCDTLWSTTHCNDNNNNNNLQHCFPTPSFHTSLIGSTRSREKQTKIRRWWDSLILASCDPCFSLSFLLLLSLCVSSVTCQLLTLLQVGVPFSSSVSTVCQNFLKNPYFCLSHSFHTDCCCCCCFCTSGDSLCVTLTHSLMPFWFRARSQTPSSLKTWFEAKKVFLNPWSSHNNQASGLRTYPVTKEGEKTIRSSFIISRYHIPFLSSSFSSSSLLPVVSTNVLIITCRRKCKTCFSHSLTQPPVKLEEEEKEAKG